MAFENLLVRAKRSIKGQTIEVQLDGVITERFSNPIRVTQNPVESGAIITDHAIVDPRKYSIDAIVSDTPLGFSAIGEIANTVASLFGDSTGVGVTRSQQAYAALVSLARLREPISITSGLDILNNMLITDIQPARDKDSSRALFFTMSFQELLLVNTRTVTRSPDVLVGDTKLDATPPVNQGRQLPQVITEQRVNSSILNKIINRIRGN